MIQIQDISKNYGEKLVLNDISLNFPKGKITSLIGGNGAGKSTLLSIISRLLAQDHGTVRVNEKKTSDYKSVKLSQQLSILKQFNNVELKLTVKELVSFGRFPYSQGRLRKEDHVKIAEALEFLDLGEMQDKYLDELSGGQRQRAFLAMVVAQDTEYILLDEPLNNLDMRHSVQIMKTLKRLTDELGKTVIIVLHDINFASHYSDYIAALKDGKVKYFGSANEVITEPILKDIFDINFCISQANGKKLCNYFSHFN